VLRNELEKLKQGSDIELSPQGVSLHVQEEVDRRRRIFYFKQCTTEWRDSNFQWHCQL